MARLQPALIHAMALAFVAFAVVPGSMGEIIKNPEELCSCVKHKHKCRDFIKFHQSRFQDKDEKGVTDAAITVARDKGYEIYQLLNRLHTQSKDDKLKAKYKTCSNNFIDAVRDLDQARNDFNNKTYHNLGGQADEAKKAFKKCRHEFDDDAFDPAHIRNRNKEFLVYVEIFKAAVQRLNGSDTYYADDDSE